jgi:hypothetical protein
MVDRDSVQKKSRANAKSKYPNDPEQTMWLTRVIKGDTMAFSYIV